jgi:hypothetical protein
MNVQEQLTAPAALVFETFRPGALAAAAAPPIPWLWHGFLAPGKVTALTSQSKSGKTTLASLLLVRLQAGGELAGLAVAPGRALVVSEEAKDDWDARCRRLGIDKNHQFVCRPFKSKRPTPAQWFSLISHLDSVHRQEGPGGARSHHDRPASDAAARRRGKLPRAPARLPVAAAGTGESRPGGLAHPSHEQRHTPRRPGRARQAPWAASSTS